MALRIGPPPVAFGQLREWLQEFYLEMARVDAENRKLRRDLEVGFPERLILPDENGDRYVVSINSSGPSLEVDPL